MQALIYSALVPHPPILVPAVGGEESPRVKTTRAALEQVCAELAALGPETVVLISPHGPVFQDAIAVHQLPEVTGNLSAFGAEEVAFSAPVDLELADLIARAAREQHLQVALVTPEWAGEWGARELDHGTLVPLHFLAQAGWQGQVLPVAMGLLPPVQLYAFGVALQKAIDRSGRRVAVLVSGDLSHRLSDESEDGFAPAGPAFDRQVVEALGRGDLEHLFHMEAGFCEEAASCALRPLMMLAGALDGVRIKPQVLSYEGPFGVGYAVVELVPGGPDPARRFLTRLEEVRRQRIEGRRNESHPAVVLARTALEHYVRTGLVLDFSAGAPQEGTAPWQLPADLPERAGTFVSLKVDGDLRGCMGSLAPAEPTLALEIVQQAVAAGTADPRFSPVEEAELPFLDYTLDILGEPESCTRADLNPAEYGVVVSRGERGAVLLPNLPGVRTAGEQLRIVCDKAGLDPGDPDLQVYRFRVSRLQ